ncbi:hypothetical protein [Bradyrhizobium sp. Leo121]|uniref:hypothetical protein n=1 Tax=Bradyrhizobium sp. Leo121 TaxID=1571195 RepID=UPI00102A2369|nr:hypothetical protein [Bradyrhizobium sp. Leo121]RZN24184.1 hypothetical protein CWO90_29275 [Bradyrhizobium sp. Leo121]
MLLIVLAGPVVLILGNIAFKQTGRTLFFRHQSLLPTPISQLEWTKSAARSAGLPVDFFHNELRQDACSALHPQR